MLKFIYYFIHLLYNFYFKHESFTVFKNTNCLMYGCFKDNTLVLFITVEIFILKC